MASSNLAFVIAIFILTDKFPQGSLNQNIIQLPTPCVHLRVKGGLGNQLFEYACSYALARKYGIPLITFLPDKALSHTRSFLPHERPFALDLFNISFTPDNSASHLNETGLFLLSDLDLIEKLYEQREDFKQLKLSVFGYCQSEYFFSKYKDELIQMFKVRENALTPSYDVWKAKIKKSKCSVCLHIRRGDFKDYMRMPISYYEEALLKMEETWALKGIEECLPKHSRNFFIFSDNPAPKLYEEFGQTFFNHLGKYEIVSGRNLTSVEEFSLMKQCHHNIIPGSSFGWWSAYLNPNKNKFVVAGHYSKKVFETNPPTPYTEYLVWQYRYLYYPANWIVLDPFRSE